MNRLEIRSKNEHLISPFIINERLNQRDVSLGTLLLFRLNAKLSRKVSRIN